MQTEFFQGDGVVRKLLREFDWSSSSVGLPETWPCELHTLINLILQVQYPAVVLWGDDNSYWYNDAYIYLLGQRHPAALGKRFRDVWPELWPEIGPTIENTMAGVPAYFECVPFTCAPNGIPEERYFTLSFSPVRDRSGKVLGMLNAGFETTNRIAEERRIAFELALSDRFRAISSAEEIVATASEMLGKELGVARVLFAEVNDAEGKYCVRQEWNSQGSPGHAGQVLRLDECDVESIDLLRSGETLVQNDVAAPPQASGGQTHVQVRARLAVPILRDGRLGMVLSLHCSEPRVWRDWEARLVAEVAQRTSLAVEAIRAQSALRESEARLSAVFESLPVGVGVVDAAGNVVLSNQEMSFYLPSRELPSRDEKRAKRWRGYRPDGKLIEPNDYPGARALRGERTVPGVEMLYTADNGKEIWTQVAAVPIHDERGKLAGQVAVVMNVDAQKRTEAALRTSEQKSRQAEEDARRLAENLANENRRKSDFLAVLAHELRNPLAPIRTGLDIIRMRSDSPEAVLRVRDMIERQTNHMIHLIDDLLDVARITTGKIELKKTIVDLNEVVASAVETSLPAIEKAQHELRLNLHDGPLMLDADEVRIGQVIGNLLTNAAKYTPQGGKISISLTREGEEAIVAVSDSGIGIPSDALESVFDMFNQIERSLGHSQGGLGIGLSLVRQLASLHGGSVSAASEGEGKGSTFTVRLPLGSCTQSAVQGQEQSLGPGNHPETHRILVVDDNADAADSLAGLLRLRGHDIRVAYSGAEAIALAQVFQPDVAFLDIGMPDMSGYDVARRLRKEPGLAQMTITALTGWGTDVDRARSAEAGFDEHLTKPMTSASLDALLAKVAR